MSSPIDRYADASARAGLGAIFFAAVTLSLIPAFERADHHEAIIQYVQTRSWLEYNIEATKRSPCWERLARNNKMDIPTEDWTLEVISKNWGCIAEDFAREIRPIRFGSGADTVIEQIRRHTRPGNYYGVRVPQAPKLREEGERQKASEDEKERRERERKREQDMKAAAEGRPILSRPGQPHFIVEPPELTQTFAAFRRLAGC